MHAKLRRPRIPLPKSLRRHVKPAVLHAISLAHYAIVHSRGRAAGSVCSGVRLSVQNERLIEECALLREEMRIKEMRLTQVSPQVSVEGEPGAIVWLEVSYQASRRHLPIVVLKRAA